MATELQPTYGNFKVQGLVQGLKRNYAFNDDPTQGGYPRHQLRFDVKTSEDNIVRVELNGMGFENIRITPQDRNDKQTKDIKRGSDIPEGWEVFMGVTTGLEQGEDGRNILTSRDQYDGAKYLHENLEDGDHVFIGGRTEYSQYTNRNTGEEVVNERLSINRVYHSNRAFDPELEDFEEVSSFNQTLILNGVDLNKKEKRAYVSALIIARDFGETKAVPATYWIDGTKYLGLIKNLQKLPFGTEIRVDGKVHSKPVYDEVASVDDSWGDTQFEKRSVITGVDKSLEITFADPSTIVEAKYTNDDLFPPAEEATSNDDNNPFAETKEESSDWGSKEGSDSSSDPDDPFSDMDEF